MASGWAGSRWCGASTSVAARLQAGSSGSCASSGTTPSPASISLATVASAPARRPGARASNVPRSAGAKARSRAAASSSASGSPAAGGGDALAHEAGGPAGSSHASSSVWPASVSASRHGSSYVPAPATSRSGAPKSGASSAGSVPWSQLRSQPSACVANGVPSADSSVAIRPSHVRSAPSGSASSRSRPAPGGGPSSGQSAGSPGSRAWRPRSPASVKPGAPPHDAARRESRMRTAATRSATATPSPRSGSVGSKPAAGRTSWGSSARSGSAASVIAAMRRTGARRLAGLPVEASLGAADLELQPLHGCQREGSGQRHAPVLAAHQLDRRRRVGG